MSTFPNAKTGTQIPVVGEGSSQYPFFPLARNREIITATDAIDIADLALLNPAARPVQSTASADLIGDGPAMFVVKPDPTALLGLKFALGTLDGVTDPNNKQALFAIVGFRELRMPTRPPQWVGTVLMDGYIVAGDSTITTGGSHLLPPGATSTLNPTNYDFNWADTIVVSNDYTIGDAAKVSGDSANGSAMLWFDFQSCPLVGIVLSCRTSTPPGLTACGAATGCWTQM